MDKEIKSNTDGVSVEAQPAISEQIQNASSGETEKGITVDDIMSRIEPVEKQDTSSDTSFFNAQDIDAIEDPKLRDSMKNIYKNMERGLQKKFQEVAEIKRSLESNASKSDKWTTERIMELTKDPDFLRAAQEVAGTNQAQQHGFTDEEWSSLTESEKARITGVESKLSKIERLLLEKEQQSAENELASIDSSLKQKYKDYDPQAINTFANDVSNGKVGTSQLRELMHKALNFDRLLTQAYNFGLNDRKSDLEKKMGINNIDGGSINTQEEKPVRKDGETAKAFLDRIFDFRLKQVKQKTN